MLMTREKAVYLAAVLDCKGSMFAAKCSPQCHTITILVTSSKPEVPALLWNKYGGYEPKKRANTHWGKASYAWRAQGKEAVRLLTAALPFMENRDTLARRLLRQYKEERRANGS